MVDKVCPLMLMTRAEEQSTCIQERCVWFNPMLKDCVLPAINRTLFKLATKENKV